MQSPTVTWLAWYIYGVLMFEAIVSSAITYHPDIQFVGVLLPPIFGACSLIACGAALTLRRLPSDHWSHDSKPVSFGLLAVAIAVTMLLTMVG